MSHSRKTRCSGAWCSSSVFMTSINRDKPGESIQHKCVFTALFKQLINCSFVTDRENSVFFCYCWVSPAVFLRGHVTTGLWKKSSFCVCCFVDCRALLMSMSRHQRWNSVRTRWYFDTYACSCVNACEYGWVLCLRGYVYGFPWLHTSLITGWVSSSFWILLAPRLWVWVTFELRSWA